MNGDATDAMLMSGAYAKLNDGSDESLGVTGFIQGEMYFTSLLRFSIASGAIPAGAIVQSGTIRVRPLEPNKGTGHVSLHLLSHPWKETTVTYANYPYGYAVTPLATAQFSEMDDINFDVTQTVMGWVSGSVPNYGVAITPPPTGLAIGYTFSVGSSESGRVPTLTICTLPSVCTGVANGTPCDEALTCVSGGTCMNSVCTGGTAAPSGTVCRDATGACDIAETCDGVSKQCPAQAVAPAGSVVCRPSAGACDVAELCDGGSTVCPTDDKVDSGTVCRQSAGACDVAEYCDGTSAPCPTDQLQPATDVCRPAAGVCDVAETCTGSSPVCPTDAFYPATRGCHSSSTGDLTCDPVWTCSGSSAECPLPTNTDGHACAVVGGGSGQCASGQCSLVCIDGGGTCTAGGEGCCPGTVCCPNNYSAGSTCVDTAWCMTQSGGGGSPTCGGTSLHGLEGQPCCTGPGNVPTCASGAVSMMSKQPLICCNGSCQGGDTPGC